ncbi:MAG: methionyl-tRNA formyltransferase [Burkholderiales bacterium]|jgi:methionyl-tRNA formyltransferase|nr:methionyl-tRNA formyltransferase [Burkholderiales bacterium]
MRIGFAGTPDFAAETLSALIAAGYIPKLTLTQPDRPKGRGMKLTPSPVKELALTHGIPVFQPSSLKSEDARASFAAIPLDVLVVSAYGLILPQVILDLPRYGCINVHASLLPRWRGAAPIQHAILAGDSETGVTLMQMDAGLDSGAMILRRATPILTTDTGGTLHDRLATIGGELAIEGLRSLEKEGRLTTTPQPESGVTYAEKIERRHALIDWQKDAMAIDRVIRAFNPYPVAHTLFLGKPLKIWRAVLLREHHVASLAGTIRAVSPEGIDVICGKGTIRLLDVQPENGKRMSVAAYLSGHGVSIGKRLGI